MEVVHVFVVLAIRVEEDAIKGTQLRSSQGGAGQRASVLASGSPVQAALPLVPLRSTLRPMACKAAACCTHLQPSTAGPLLPTPPCRLPHPLPHPLPHSPPSTHLVNHVLPPPEHKVHAWFAVPPLAARVLVDVRMSLYDRM